MVGFDLLAIDLKSIDDCQAAIDWKLPNKKWWQLCEAAQGTSKFLTKLTSWVAKTTGNTGHRIKNSDKDTHLGLGVTSIDLSG